MQPLHLASALVSNGRDFVLPGDAGAHAGSEGSHRLLQSLGRCCGSQPVPRGCTQARGREVGTLGFHQVPSRLARPLRVLGDRAPMEARSVMIRRPCVCASGAGSRQWHCISGPRLGPHYRRRQTGGRTGGSEGISPWGGLAGRGLCSLQF